MLIVRSKTGKVWHRIIATNVTIKQECQYGFWLGQVLLGHVGSHKEIEDVSMVGELCKLCWWGTLNKQPYHTTYHGPARDVTTKEAREMFTRLCLRGIKMTATEKEQLAMEFSASEMMQICNFVSTGGVLDTDIMIKLQEFFKDEIPYGTAKARIGDPYNWMYHRLSKILD